MIVMTSTDSPYVDTNEEFVECSFRSLEFINATFVGEGSRVIIPRVSRSSLLKVSKFLQKWGQAGKGLGRNL